MGDYTSTARALALPIDHPPSPSPSTPNHPPSNARGLSSPAWSRRRSLSRPSTTHPSLKIRLLTSLRQSWRSLMRLYFQFTPLQRFGMLFVGTLLFVSLVLFAVYNARIYASLAPYARSWRETPGAWTILWLATFLVSFPPLLGYSTCVMLAGFVYGMRGWLIVASATVAGSTASFVVSRSVLRRFVQRLVGRDARFAALGLVLKHDGLKLLVMIRLCPLPYSLSNGAISTVPTVSWRDFMLATALASPKLLLHVFVGARLDAIAEGGEGMDARTKTISYVGIVVGVCAGAGTGWFMYTRTTARARQLEEEEAAAAAAVDDIGDSGDDISLHEARMPYEQEEDEDEDEGYRDESTEDEELRDVFAEGDGDEEEGGKKAEK